MKISLCMIVRNEEKTIGRCLECVQDICDEIIIVDTGSTDQTKKIATQYTQNIYDFNWIDDFSKARNFAFSKASQDYIMWLDADDIIDDENIEKIKVLKRSLKEDIDVVMMQYQMGKESDYVFSRERLVKRKNNYQWVGAVHEYIEITGKIMYSDIKIIHQKEKVTNSHRNIRIYEKMIKEGKTLNTRELFYYARELMEHHQYDKAIVYFEKFLIQKDGWKENKIEACLDLSYCYREMNNSHKALQILLYSFLFDNPRSEIMCQIGFDFYVIRAI